MALSSVTFLLFIFVTVLVYYIVPKKIQWIVLLLSSFCFYVTYSAPAVVYILFTTITTYISARMIHKLQNIKSDNADKSKIKRKNKAILVCTLIANFSMLLIFKYSNFIIDNMNSIFKITNIEFSISRLKLLLPIGISFYIFQSMGYLIDVYRKKYSPETNIAKFALFVSYFPQIIQGPINKFDLLQKQLLEEHKCKAENIQRGIQLIIWGLLKKMIVADMLYFTVNEIYTNYVNYSGIVIFIGVAIYCIQLYCDFSGGIDVVRGVSELFGIEMMGNFNSPYFATSIADFWRRWHISLGEWMKDYVFYSLALSKGFGNMGKGAKKVFGNNIGKMIPVCVATFITFILVGIWQGPGWSNVAYGIWNGSIMSISMLLANRFKTWIQVLKIQIENFGYRLFQIVRTWLLVCIGRYFSGSISFLSAIGMLKSTILNVKVDKTIAEQCVLAGLTKDKLIVLGISIAILIIVGIIKEKTHDVRSVLNKQRWLLQTAITFVSVFILIVFVYLNTNYTSINFIYANV